MNQHLQNILNIIQQGEDLSADQKEAVIKSLKGADKEIEITSFKLDRTEKVKRTTAILLEETIEELEQKRKSVEAQNRDLEIESSLERVRTVAMSMNKPDDMLHVCKTIAEQLEFLKVKEIRNVQTAIFYESKQTYINYEFYAKHDKSLITEVDYNNHAVQKAFADQMLKGPNEIFTHSFKGQEVQDWYKAQKSTNVFLDSYLEKAAYLNYYWYSLGPVALGISTYYPLSEQETNLFKRFLKVFELSYRRYLDIEKAEAQVREAQIELALERVRAKTMAMHNSADVGDTVATMFDEVVKLGIETIRCGIGIMHDGGEMEVWTAKPDEHGKADLIVGRLDMMMHPLLTGAYNSWEKNIQFYKYELKGDDLINYFNAINNHPDYPIKYDTESLPSRIIHSEFHFAEGTLFVFSLEGLSAETLKIFRRFAGVFGQTYRRYLDLQQAEAQVRESQIQLALERARAQSMIMQNSSELDNTLRVFHEQVLLLGINSAFSFLWLPDEEKHNHIFWATWAEDTNDSRIFKSKAITYPLDRNEPATAQCLIDWKSGEPVYSYAVPPEGVEGYFGAWKELIEGVEKLKPEFFKDGLYYVEAFMKYGCFGVMLNVDLSEDQKKMLTRFAIEFERAYTRFLDLQKAEAQSRESQIQLALERVRARTMAMQRSDELAEVATLLFKQINDLDIKTWTTGFNIWSDDNNSYEDWITNPGGGFIEPYTVRTTEFSSFSEIRDAKTSGVKFFEQCLEGDLLKQTYEELSKFGDKKQFEKMLEGGFQFPTRQYDHFVFGSKVSLMFITYEPVPESHEIFKRFGQVFEQTYTRFLDLKKAEAQVREAQIEAALEKVRSRSLAMHKSGEILEVVRAVFERLTELSVELNTAFIIIFKKDSRDTEWWLINRDKGEYSDILVPYTELVIFKDIFETRERGQELFLATYRSNDKKEMFKYLFTQTDFKYAPPERQKYILEMEALTISMAMTEKIAIQITRHDDRIFSEEDNEIVKRFAKVFDQAYTRFLDLKKAEAQAREAQIELSLERIRAKTMAMHNSNDVAEAVAAMFDELIHLGAEKSIRCGIGIIDESMQMEVWTAYSKTTEKVGLVVGRIDMSSHQMLSGVFHSWKNHETHSSYTLMGEDEIDYYRAINASADYPAKFDIEGLPQKQYQNAFYFREGFIYVFSPEQLPIETVQIFKRFASAFGLTYRRFLDLQKAEAQTREAQIEAAMEKVRSRALAMQKPNELIEVAQVLRKEMNILGVEELETSSIYIHHDDTGTTECWYAIKDITHPDKKLVADHMVIDLSETSVGKQMLEFYRSGKKRISIPMQGHSRKEWINYCADHSKVLIGFYGDDIPDRTYHLYRFSNGYMGAASPGDISTESWDLLQRATSVFSLAYTRFSDLQQAEAQAREAKIEAALERVRSRTLAMQKSDELAETAAVLFRQLINLGIAPNRLYIGIIKDDKGHIEFWVTDEDGRKVSTQFVGDIHKSSSMKKMYEEWNHEKKSVTIDMQGQELSDYFHYLAEELNVTFKDGLTQTRRIQSIAYFGRGFIGIASPEEQPDETIGLLERFAAVFNLTYTRFNDLKVAEAHAIQAEEDLVKLHTEKKRAEEALTELRATQAQLIQSEKMASLGELTAGIAHEIQNPLNFVNNFSEVSNELIDEMNAEIARGDMVEARAIANDIKQNLEKINHHGKRADAIVKGMLQHSGSSSSTKESTDINKLADEYFRLAYHGLRAKDKSFNAILKTDFDEDIGNINIIPQDIGRVTLNLITNAFYAVGEKKKLGIHQYEPTVSVSTKKINKKIELKITDNGNGIPEKILAKIFQPFFTTKPTGQGTGLGLSLAYDIVKVHGGEIKVETKEGNGTAFIVQLPIA